MDMSSFAHAGLWREVSELLLAGGYFRARLTALTPFDKIIGGLAWAVTTCSVDVDYDIFYHDDLKLGDKIALGERVEEALKRMKCPHPLQAHQIQGLDLPALLPVVRWLVKQVLATRAEFGDVTRAYAVHEHGCHYADVCDDVLKHLSHAKQHKARLDALAARYRPGRTLRRRADVVLPAEAPREQARWVLMEYGHRGLVRVAPGAVTPPTGAAASAAAAEAGDAGAAAAEGESGKLCIIVLPDGPLLFEGGLSIAGADAAKRQQ